MTGTPIIIELSSTVTLSVMSALGTSLLAYVSWKLRTQQSDHVRKVRIMSALRAEILDKKIMAEVTFSSGGVEMLCEMMETNSEYVPHFTIEEYACSVFDSTINDLPLLPPDVIDLVVGFYRWDRATHSAFLGMTKPPFVSTSDDAVTQLSPARRSAMLRGSHELLKEFTKRATDAQAALEHYINIHTPSWERGVLKVHGRTPGEAMESKRPVK